MSTTLTHDLSPSTAPIGPTATELDRARRLYEDALPQGNLRIFDISGLDRLGMTVYVATFTGTDGFVQDGFGYGTTAAEAAVGALGEISETVHVDAALKRSPVRVSGYADLVAAEGADRVLDPLTLCLPAGSDYTPEMQIAWVQVTRWPDGLPGWAPLECIATSLSQYEGLSRGTLPLFRPITCGLGAGTSIEMALSHGVLELLQRDGNCTAFRAMDRGIVLERDAVADPGLRALYEQLGSNGIDATPKLASTEFGLTNLYVVGTGLETDLPLMQTACGEAVHANAERALRKATLEFVAARCRKAFMHGPLDQVDRVAPDGYLDSIRADLDISGEEPRAMREMGQWLTLGRDALLDQLAPVFTERERVNLSSLHSAPDAAVSDAADRVRDLTARLAEESIPIWVFDASPDGSDRPSVIKAIAPGLEGETMSYYRIGTRGALRLLERGSPLVSREDSKGRARIRMTARDEAMSGGPFWLDTAEVDRIVGPLYPLYREPSSHALRFAAEE